MVEQLNRIVHSKAFSRFILGAILLTAVLVGLETLPEFDDSTAGGQMVLFAQNVILWLFLVEALMKIGAHGSRPWRYFLDPWNVFDFTIVAICFLPLHTNFMAIFRIARVLRTLRLVSAFPQLQLMVGALLRSIPSLGYVGVLLLLHFYIYAVVGTFLFRDNDPVQFGTLPRTMLTLFQVITLEAWPEYMRTQMYGSDAYNHDDDVWQTLAQGSKVVPQAWPYIAPIYFGTFIFFGAMIILNLFTGIIIQGLEGAQDEVAEAKRKQDAQSLGRDLTVADELDLLGTELREVSERMHSLKSSLQNSQTNGPEAATA